MVVLIFQKRCANSHMVVMAVDLSILNIYKSKLACFLLEQSTHPKLG